MMSTLKRAELVALLTREVRKFIAGTILFNESVAASVGLNATDLQFLNLLELGLASTPGELARWSGLTSGGVTVVLDRLERAGFIQREPNPADRRSVLIRTVPARARKLQSRYRTKGELLVSTLAVYSEDELRLILDFFTRTNDANRPDS